MASVAKCLFVCSLVIWSPSFVKYSFMGFSFFFFFCFLWVVFFWLMLEFFLYLDKSQFLVKWIIYTSFHTVACFFKIVSFDKQNFDIIAFIHLYCQGFFFVFFFFANILFKNSFLLQDHSSYHWKCLLSLTVMQCILNHKSSLHIYVEFYLDLKLLSWHIFLSLLLYTGLTSVGALSLDI